MAKRSKQSRKPKGARVETVSGRTLFTVAGGAATTISISPASFSRCLAMADVFQFYRFVDIKLVINPNDATVTAGYAPGALFDTPPTTSGTILELPLAVNHAFIKSVDTILHVPRSELLPDSQIMWFKTIPGTPASQFEIQGNIYIAAPGAAGSIHYIEWTCEFQSWNLAAQSPLCKVPQSITSNSERRECDEKSFKIANTISCSEEISVNGVTYKKSSA